MSCAIALPTGLSDVESATRRLVSHSLLVTSPPMVHRLNVLELSAKIDAVC